MPAEHAPVEDAGVLPEATPGVEAPGSNQS